MITQISDADVHQITSGQVIVDVSSAVKEIVENSLDAGASRVDITVKNYGLDTIEVADNGIGVDSKDYDSICVKHSTSKISCFEDVSKVRTLGFRGEAMSSLCALGRVSIVTCTEAEAPRAAKLEYDEMGRLVKKSIIPGAKGTKVVISHLFEKLPVRRKDFTKNSKREFTKLVSVLNEYAIICEGVRISISHITLKGKRNSMLATQGSHMRSNVTNVFGSNGLYGLIPVDLDLDVSGKFRLAGDYTVKMSGFLSNCSFGQGRSSSDRQFLYINKRPVQLKRFAKAICEVYKGFNHVQVPVIILNLEVDPSMLDVNVTPDKRTVMMHKENLVVDYLKEALEEFYRGQAHVIPKNEDVKVSGLRRVQQDVEFESRDAEKGPRGVISKDEAPKSEDDQSENFQRKNLDLAESEPEPESDQEPQDIQVDEIQIDKLGKPGNDNSQPSSDQDKADDSDDDSLLEESDSETEANPSSFTQTRKYKTSDTPHQNAQILETLNPFKSPNQHSPNSLHSCNAPSFKTPSSLSKSSPLATQSQTSNTQLLQSTKLNSTPPELSYTPSRKRQPSASNQRPKRLNSQPLVKPIARDSLHNLEITLSRPHIQQSRSAGFSVCSVPEKPSKLNRKQTDNIEDSSAAEEKLTLTVSKTDFLNMSIAGQFNLGFIIVTRRKNEKLDLFIIDQHASDEIYNFERLSRDTVFQSQPLVIPRSVDLNSIDELSVMDNVGVFEKNGYKLCVDENEEPGNRVKLKSLPVSVDTVFDFSDFDEILHLIKKSESTLSKAAIRPSKIRSMFAMRACRSSIMIGKPLKQSTMKTVVHHLSELDKPWNCPHGRPTMRHLMELASWTPFRDDYV